MYPYFETLVSRLTTLSCSLLLLTCSLNAQSPEKAESAVYYSFSYMGDTLNPHRLYEENMVLYFNKNASCFLSYDKIKQDQKNRINPEAALSGYSTNQIPKRTIQSVMYRFENEKKFIINENELKAYIMEDNVTIKWTILDSVKIIEGLECQKATGQFRGRSYYAWFTSSIPSSYGPWKLGGLPGLIIEATDAKNHVNFRFSGTENLKNNPFIIEVPKNAIQITKKDFQKIKDAIANDPIAYLNNTMGVQLQPLNGATARPVRKSNNPIELTEN